MKGADQNVLPKAEGAVPGDVGWKPEDAKKGKEGKNSKKGKDRAEAPIDVKETDEDDDAAWLRKRQNAALEVEDEIAADGPVVRYSVDCIEFPS